MNAPTAVIEREAAPMVRQSATPADLVRYAMDTNADLDRLEKLMTMQIQWEEREARKAYIADMAEFKRNPPTILKDNHVSFKTDRGTTSYWHATIGNVVEKIVAGLAEYGFSHRWIPERLEGGTIRITCVITHRLGHSESTVLEAPMDASGGKNNIQAMISTKTYLERHSLLAATGLATKDMADDYDEKEAAKRAAEDTAKAEAAKKPAGLPPYPEESFKKMLKKWVDGGTKTADEFIATLSTKGVLSEAQIAAVRAVKKPLVGEVLAPEDQSEYGEMTQAEIDAARARELKEAGQ